MSTAVDVRGVLYAGGRVTGLDWLERRDLAVKWAHGLLAPCPDVEGWASWFAQHTDPTQTITGRLIGATYAWWHRSVVAL